jgi:glycosyltransferase involved in cell wall biosynthesis
MELGRMVAGKSGIKNWLTHETGKFCTDKCVQYIDGKVARFMEKYRDISGVYAYEDGALETFLRAKKSGIKCIYDLPIGYYKAMHEMLSEEKEKHPAWATTLGCFKDSKKKLQRKDEELALADIIFVASSFTKDTLQKFKGKLSSIKVIPYGFPVVESDRKYSPLQNRKLKVLFVGGLSQRKGIAYLFEAIENVRQWVDLTVVGGGNIESCPALKKELSNCNYIPSLPHYEILQLMSVHDVLIFPSLFEGFGLVVTEAMSRGTPVITTERTCGPDIITHGKNGWLIEAGSSEAISRQLDMILSNSDMIEKAGKEAIQSARQRPWDKYGMETVEAIMEFNSNVGL